MPLKVCIMSGPGHTTNIALPGLRLVYCYLYGSSDDGNRGRPGRQAVATSLIEPLDKVSRLVIYKT